jgi:hypothetical protein
MRLRRPADDDATGPIPIGDMRPMDREGLSLFSSLPPGMQEFLQGGESSYLLPPSPANDRRTSDASRGTQPVGKSTRAPVSSEPWNLHPQFSSGIFISYRRADDQSFAGRLQDNLVANFGRDHIFMDVDSIELGVDFKEVVDDRIARSSAMLVVIGKDWLRCIDEQGRRRLDDPYDFVRLEVEAALSHSTIRVIPVLYEGAVIPNPQELPESLKALASRNAINIAHRSFGRDFSKLLEALQKIFNST